MRQFRALNSAPRYWVAEWGWLAVGGGVEAAGALPLDLLKSEQQRLASELNYVEERLGTLELKFDIVERNLKGALKFVGNLHTAYVEANHRVRRQINQALFERLLISSDGDITAELRPPFNLLLQASGTADQNGAIRPQANNKPRGPWGPRGLSKHELVELNGTLSNREVMVETSKLHTIKARLLATAPTRAEPATALGERAGRIKQTVIQVLETAGLPLRVAEISEACEQLLGIPVNRSTISDCLIKHSAGDRRLVDRTARGEYAWRSS